MAPSAKPSGGINVQHEGSVDPSFKGEKHKLVHEELDKTRGLYSKKSDKYPRKHDNSLTRPTVHQTKKDSTEATSTQLLEHPQSASSSTNKLNPERAREQDARGAKPIVHVENTKNAMGTDLELMYVKLKDKRTYNLAITNLLRESSVVALFGKSDYEIACNKLEGRLHEAIESYKVTRKELGDVDTQQIISSWKASEDDDVRKKGLALEEGKFARRFLDEVDPVPASRKAQDAGNLVEHRTTDYEKFVIRELKSCRGRHLPLATDSEKSQMGSSFASFNADEYEVLCGEIKRELHDPIYVYKRHLGLHGNVNAQRIIQDIEVNRRSLEMYGGVEKGQFAYWFLERIDPERARIHALSVSLSEQNIKDAEAVILKYKMFIDQRLVRIRGRHVPLAAGSNMPPIFVPFGDDGHKLVCDKLKRELKKNIDHYVRELTNGNVVTQRKMYNYRADESEFTQRYGAEIEKGQFAYWFINKVDPRDVLRQAVDVGRTPSDREIAAIVANDYTRFIKQKLEDLDTIKSSHDAQAHSV